jgi:hypothetical protein
MGIRQAETAVAIQQKNKPNFFIPQKQPKLKTEQILLNLWLKTNLNWVLSILKIQIIKYTTLILKISDAEEVSILNETNKLRKEISNIINQINSFSWNNAANFTTYTFLINKLNNCYAQYCESGFFYIANLDDLIVNLPETVQIELEELRLVIFARKDWRFDPLKNFLNDINYDET